MTTLNDLKTEYQTKLDRAIAEQARREQETETMRQLKLDGLRPRIITWIAQHEGIVDTTELSQYGEVMGDWDSYEATKLRYATFTLTLPEHQPVNFTFYEDKEGRLHPSNKWWKVDQSGRSHDTLGEALTMAAGVYQKNQEWLEKEEADSLLYEAQKVDKEDREAR